MVALCFGWTFLYIVRNNVARIMISAVLLFIGIMGNPLTIINLKLYDLLYPHLLAIPFMYFGVLVKEQKLCISVSTTTWVVVTIVIVCEALYLYLDHGITSQFYIMTYIFAAVSFLYCKDLKSKFVEIIAPLGREHSLFIYIYHLAFISIFCRYIDMGNDWMHWIAYTLGIWFFCLALSVLLKKWNVTLKLMLLLEGRWIR